MGFAAPIKVLDNFAVFLNICKRRVVQVLQHQFDVEVSGDLPSDYPRFGISMVEKV